MSPALRQALLPSLMACGRDPPGYLNDVGAPLTSVYLMVLENCVPQILFCRT